MKSVLMPIHILIPILGFIPITRNGPNGFYFLVMSTQAGLSSSFMCVLCCRLSNENPVPNFAKALL